MLLAYAETALLPKGSEWRQPSKHVRASISTLLAHGLIVAYPAGASGPRALQVRDEREELQSDK